MADLDELLGVHGEGFGIRSIVSDVAGVFGEGFGFSANSFLFVRTQSGQPVNNINFSLSWNGGAESIVGYDSAFLYLKTRVTDTPITITFAGSANFKPFTSIVQIPSGEFRRFDVVLEFNEAFFKIIPIQFS